MGILIIFNNNLLLTSILLFTFSLLILNFNFHFKSILFYIFNLIFIRGLFLLILFILSIRGLILNSFYNFNYFNFIILIRNILNNLHYFDIKFSEFLINLNFVIILGLIILLVFLSLIFLSLIFLSLIFLYKIL